MVKLHEPEPKDDTKCVQLAAEYPPAKKFAHIVTEVGVSPLDTKVVMGKKKQQNERIIRYNRDTLITMQSSAYALTTPKCVVDAIESGNKKRWLRFNETDDVVVGDKNRKLNTHKDTIRPLQTNNVLPPLLPRASDDVGSRQSPTIDDKTLQNQRQRDDDQSLIIEKNDGNTFSSGAPDRERRIGSGRIPTNINPRDFRPSGGLVGLRDRESIGPASVSSHHNMNQSLPALHRGRSDRSDFWNDRFDGRSVNRDFEQNRGGAFNRNANQKGRFMSNNMHSTGDGRHVYNEHRGQGAEDPEWFSCGPTSRHDTIELRGFDDPEPDENPATVLAKHSMSAALKPSGHQTPRSVTFADEEDDANNTQTTNNSNCPSPPPAMSTPTKTAFARNAGDSRGNIGQHLSYDEIFKIPEAKSGTAENQSRFGGWLKNDAAKLEDRQYKTAEFFAASRGMPENNSNATNSSAFLDLLRRGNLSTQMNNDLMMLQQLQRQQLPISGQVYSVDDLEERMRTGNVRSKPGSSRIQNVDELETQLRSRNEQGGATARPNPSDSSALKNLFTQMRGVGTQQMHQQQQQQLSHQNVQLNQQLQQSAAGLMQILTANIQQRQAAGSMPTYEQLRMSNLMNHMTPHQQFLYQQKIQHQQQMHQHQQQRMDLMNMPPHEQQALYHYLSQGEVTQESLSKKLANPALAPSERHLILSALNLARIRVRLPQQANMTAPDHDHGAAAMSPSAVEANAYTAAAGAERHTAPNSPGVSQRMPSPHELKVLTESIMKGALFKKKMEEEREYLKRQEWLLQQQTKAFGLNDVNRRDDVEMHRNLSLDLHQSPGKKPIIGRKTPPGKFSFLPTSEMREKVAENDFGASGAVATVADNLNDQANHNWLPSKDASMRSDTQTVQNIASTAVLPKLQCLKINQNSFDGENVGPSNQIRSSDPPTFRQQNTERNKHPTQNNVNADMSHSLPSLGNDKNIPHKR